MRDGPAMPALPRWPAAFRISDIQPRDRSISRQLRRLLIAAGALLCLLIAGQLAALSTNRIITARLVDARIAPMSELQAITVAYRTGWTIADKVRVGTIDATGGATALQDIRGALRADWAALDRSAPDIAGAVAPARPAADAALARLQTLLDRQDRDGLDFFLSGPFYGGVDPLLGGIDQAIEGLRTTADHDRRVLRWVNSGAELLLIAISLGAAIGGVLVARRGEARIVQPLTAIAEHLRRARTGDGEPVPVPGVERADEVGAIARALAQAQDSERSAEAIRREQGRIEDALRQRELAETRAAQMRAQLMDANFARFDTVLAQLVAALSTASQGMRDMATTLAAASAQLRDRADVVAHNVSATARRVDVVQQESLGLLRLVADMRRSAATARMHGRDVIDQSVHNRSQAQLLSELVDGMAQALDLIRRIAGQTNLLSVNANIEAHRSGAAGLGFAVVAREIKVLAIDSTRTAGEIAEQLQRVGRTAGNFLDSASRVEELAMGVGRQADAVEALAGSQEEAGRRMAGSIADTRSEIREITDAAEDTRAGSVQLVDAARTLRDTADAIADQIAELHGEFNALRVNVREAV